MRTFSTADFIDQLNEQFRRTWQRLVDEYGEGGEGAGTYYSANSRVAQVLHSWSKNGEVRKLDYQAAPAGWGSPVIRYWTLDTDGTGQLFPEEIDDDEEYWEGTKTQILVNRYELDPAARKKCIEHFGLKCAACDIDFREKYGERGSGFIHVHHRKPLSEIKKNYKINPISDLIPVCPNCHAMIHRNEPLLTVDELKSILTSASEWLGNG